MRTKRSLIIGAIAFIFIILAIVEHQDALAQKESEKENSQQHEPLVVEVVLERLYLDGEFSQEVIEETIWSMEDFWSKYDSWQLIDMEESKVVFRERVDDISPLLKSNGYFGITNDGILTIYNGDPGNAQIIHTFFHIDLGKLESKKHEQLKKGIPIKNKDRYVEVLETFKTYSLDKKQAN